MGQLSQAEKKAGVRDIILGLIFIIVLLAGVGCVLYLLVTRLGPLLTSFFASLSSLDSAVIVALITGMISIISFVGGNLVSSMMKKKEYLRERRESPYMKLISLVYDMQGSVRDSKEVSQERLNELIDQFNRELTLWGSSKAIRLWGNWRTSTAAGHLKPLDLLLGMEKVLVQLRKDMGIRGRLSKGDILRLTINDFDEVLKEQGEHA